MSTEVQWLDLEEILSSPRTRQGSSFTLTSEMTEQTSVISMSATSKPLLSPRVSDRSGSTALGCAMVPPPPELELETPAVSLSGVVERFAPTIHSRSFFIARFASRCWFPTSFRSCNKIIASYDSLSHFSVSGHLFVVLALIAPTRVLTRCLLVLVDLYNQMPKSHGEPNLPSWIPDSFARNCLCEVEQRTLELGYRTSHGRIGDSQSSPSKAVQAPFVA